MFDCSISASELGQRIGRFAARAHDGRQVSARLRQLLPTRLTAIQAKYRKQTKRAGKALRLALQDKAYIGQIDEFVEVRANTHEARVLYETHKMLQLARASIRAWHRPD